MGDDTRRRRILREYVDEREERDDQPVTERFATLEAPVRAFTVERPVCAAHSGVCVEMANVKAEVGTLRNDVSALKADKGSMRAFWFALIAAAVGSGIGAAVSVLAR
jgi:hypothetical protein